MSTALYPGRGQQQLCSALRVFMRISDSDPMKAFRSTELYLEPCAVSTSRAWQLWTRPFFFSDIPTLPQTLPLGTTAEGARHRQKGQPGQSLGLSVRRAAEAWAPAARAWRGPTGCRRGAGWLLAWRKPPAQPQHSGAPAGSGRTARTHRAGPGCPTPAGQGCMLDKTGAHISC